MDKYKYTWRPAEPFRLQDQIISSKARAKKEAGFKPTYEDEKTDNMNFIMSNEYQRLWFRDRKAYEKRQGSRGTNIKTTPEPLMRRFVQKMMTFRTPTKIEISEGHRRIKKEKAKKNVESEIGKNCRYKVTECPKDLKQSKQIKNPKQVEKIKSEKEQKTNAIENEGSEGTALIKKDGKISAPNKGKKPKMSSVDTPKEGFVRSGLKIAKEPTYNGLGDFEIPMKEKDEIKSVSLKLETINEKLENEPVAEHQTEEKSQKSDDCKSVAEDLTKTEQIARSEIYRNYKKVRPCRCCHVNL